MKKLLFIFLATTLCGCGPSKEEKAKLAREEQARVEALARQKADSIANVEREKLRKEAEERQRKEAEERRRMEEAREAEEARILADRNAEALLDGIWSEYSSIEDAQTTDGFEPFAPGDRFDVYSHTIESVRIYYTKTTKENSFVYEYKYENGNIYGTDRQGNSHLWYTFDKDKMILRRPSGKILRKWN